jgi:hypothetical protein
MPKTHPNHTQIGPTSASIAHSPQHKHSQPLVTAWIHQPPSQILSKPQNNIPALKWNYHIIPPRIEILSHIPLVPLEQPKYNLQLQIHSEHAIQDLFLHQNRRKIFYRYIPTKTKAHQSLKIDIPIQLKPGINRLRIFVRTPQSRFHKDLKLTYLTQNIRAE